MRFASLAPLASVTLAVAAALAACASNPPTAAEACKEVVAARCTRLAACSPADMQKRYGDEATCETRQTLSCLASLAAADTGNTPDTVIACADTLPTEACAEFLSTDLTDACMPQTGKRAAGAACEFNAQCASTFCAVASTAQCGTCQPLPTAGTSCAAASCAAGQVCVASTMMCEVPVAASGACSDAMPCATGYACVGADAATSTNGTCMAQPTTASAPCDPKRKTAPDCSGDAGLTCDATSNTCVAQPIVAVGATCGNVNNVVTRCAGGATCVRATGAATGTCTAPAADGAACDTAAGPGCLTPSKCVTAAGSTAGTCEAPGMPGCS